MPVSPNRPRALDAQSPFGRIRNGIVIALLSLSACELNADGQGSTTSTLDQTESAEPTSGGSATDSTTGGSTEAASSSNLDSSSTNGPNTTTGSNSGETTAASTGALDGTTGGPYCGDGKLGPGEQCDGKSFPENFEDCASIGLGEGELACNIDCTLNLDGCSVSNEEKEAFLRLLSQTLEGLDGNQYLISIEKVRQKFLRERNNQLSQTNP